MRSNLFVLLCLAFTACNQQGKKNAIVLPPSHENPPIENNQLITTLNLQQYVDAPPQLFTVAAGSTIITAKQGLKLHVKTGDFETEDGQLVTGPIELTVKELVTKQQLIASDCPTASDGRLLETAGSYFIGASGNGSKLRLKPGRKMRIEFPKRGDNMELFYGQRMADGSMNWQPVKKKLSAVSEAAEAWEARNKVEAAPVYVDAPAKNYDAYTGASSGRFFTTEVWFKAYHDTIMTHRRSIIRKHFKNMTQPQIRKVMEAPFKMSVKDYTKFISPLNNRRYFSHHLHYHEFEGFDLYITADNKTDSVIYFRDTIAYRARVAAARKEDSLRRASGNYTMYDNLETDVDIDKTVKRKKNGKLVTEPGNAKVTIRYYEPVELEQLGWINCDRFYNYPDGIVPEYTLDIKGKVPPAIGVYVIYKNINGVMSNKISTNGQVKNTIRQQLPVNAEVEFLVYSKMGNQFLQSKHTARITKGMVVPVNLQPVPDEQVKKMLMN
jgi:hypothetical protein